APPAPALTSAATNPNKQRERGEKRPGRESTITTEAPSCRPTRACPRRPALAAMAPCAPACTPVATRNAHKRRPSPRPLGAVMPPEPSGKVDRVRTADPAEAHRHRTVKETKATNEDRRAFVIVQPEVSPLGNFSARRATDAKPPTPRWMGPIPGRQSQRAFPAA